QLHYHDPFLQITYVSTLGGYESGFSLLDGTAGGDRTVTITSTNDGIAFNNLAADTFSIDGTAGDTYVASVSFDASTGNALGGASNMQLLWRNPATNGWELAALGNSGPSNSPTFINGAYDPTSDFILGYYGVDVVNHTVWAVINHDSSFS